MSRTARSMPLVDLLPSAAVLQGDSNVSVSGIATDSRQVTAGDLFVAQTGLAHRGSDYANDAAANGAIAILTDDADLNWTQGGVPLAYLPELNKNLSAIAGEFYGLPSSKLSVTGITGTNGKTSCCYWYAWLSNQLGKPCGQIGTLGAGYQRRSAGVDVSSLKSTGFTTPDAVQTQALLAEIEAAGAAAAVMEVSSHGLHQGRVEAVAFEAAIFTNLTQDHLDYHGDMDSYYAAKASLFARPELKRVVLNHDDPASEKLKRELRSGVQLFSYSVHDTSADLFLSSLNWSTSGAEVEFDGRWGKSRTQLPLIGEYNLANLLAVMTAHLASDVDLSALVNQLQGLPSVPGRMQMLVKAGAPTVVIDYAHTPDAVKNALRAVRDNVSGKLISVLGCGGDRDQTKRPLMGKLACGYSDECWFTSDNPRSEDPAKILQDMLRGASGENVRVEEKRDRAIQLAVSSAKENDLVMVLGKGHETYQEIAGVRHSFSDLEHCLRAQEIRAKRGVGA